MVNITFKADRHLCSVILLDVCRDRKTLTIIELMTLHFRNSTEDLSSHWIKLVDAHNFLTTAKQLHS